MVALWDDYVRRNHVVLPNRSPFETLEDQLPPRVPVQAGYPPLNLKRQYVPPADMLADRSSEAPRITATSRRSRGHERRERFYEKGRAAGARAGVARRPGRARSGAGVGPGARALLLEDPVGRERGSLIFNSLSGNTNPFDPSHLVTPGANVDATLGLFGYARTFTWEVARPSSR